MKKTLITIVAMLIIVGGVGFFGWWFLPFSFIAFIGWSLFNMEHNGNPKDDVRIEDEDKIDWF